jgi:hypothetical protein
MSVINGCLRTDLRYLKKAKADGIATIYEGVMAALPAKIAAIAISK